MAAYGKSADILKLIKTRLGSDEGMKRYLANELARSGAEVGDFMSKELMQKGQRTVKEMKASSDKALKDKLAKEAIKAQEQAKKPLDSVTFGSASNFGDKTVSTLI